MPPTPVSRLIVRDQQTIDDDHLRILAVLHFVTAGLAVLGLLFVALHFTIMHSVFGNPDMWKNQQGGDLQPDEFFAVFQWMYLLMAAGLVGGAIVNVLSGLYLRKKKHRLFSMIVAGLNCIHMPLGTALGVFTFIVLLRDTVRQAYLED